MVVTCRVERTESHINYMVVNCRVERTESHINYMVVTYRVREDRVTHKLHGNHL